MQILVMRKSTALQPCIIAKCDSNHNLCQQLLCCKVGFEAVGKSERWLPIYKKHKTYITSRANSRNLTVDKKDGASITQASCQLLLQNLVQ